MTASWIDTNPVWGIPRETLGCAEGIAFSRCGRLFAIAHALDQKVTVYQRGVQGWPASLVTVIEGPESGVDYPHDVDFSPDGRLLVVANRKGKSLTAYAREPGAGARFADTPVWTLRGRFSRLRHPDGAKFVPPHGGYLAAVNLTRDTVTFYRRRRLRGWRYSSRACFVLKGPKTRLAQPDGLAFTDDGELLAVTNHGAGTVTLYARRGRAPRYGPAPVVELRRDPTPLQCPHSVAFSRGGRHLAISNAGGRTVSVYRRNGPDPGAWSEIPVLELDASDPREFELANGYDRREGGSKGVAFGADCFGVCSPTIGLRVHCLSAEPGAASGPRGRG